MDWFWLIFLIMMLQPVLKKQLQEASRQRWIARMEAKNGSRVILLVHRQETMSFLGFPFMRFIDIHDSEEILRAVHLTDPEMPIDLVLHTPGGLVLAATQIASVIQSHPGKVRVYVPHFAMSGGTLIAMAADEIIMAEHAVMGPVDPQLGDKPAASILAAVEKKEPKDIDDTTLILADQAAKARKQVEQSVYCLLQDKMEETKARELAATLSEGHWTHDYGISYDEAQKLGLNVSKDIPEEIFQLMALFPQPVRNQAGVEYLPRRRGKDA